MNDYEKRCKDNPHVCHLPPVSCETSGHESGHKLWCTHPDCMDPVMDILGKSLKATEDAIYNQMKDKNGI